MLALCIVYSCCKHWIHKKWMSLFRTHKLTFTWMECNLWILKCSRTHLDILQTFKFPFVVLCRIKCHINVAINMSLGDKSVSTTVVNRVPWMKTKKNRKLNFEFWWNSSANEWYLSTFSGTKYFYSWQAENLERH